MIGIPSLEALFPDGHPELGPEWTPRNDMGESCPWPYDPLFLCGQPLGMYHCPYCGAMVVACSPHPDYTELAFEFFQIGAIL